MSYDEMQGEDRLNDYELVFVNAVLWMRSVRGRPTLEEFSKAMRELEAYGVARAEPCSFN